MDLQEAVRWTEMMRASKIDPSAMPAAAAANGAAIASGTAASVTTSGTVTALNDSASPTPEQQHEHKKKTPLWKL